MRKILLAALLAGIGVVCLGELKAQNPNYNMNVYYNYPYYYFPHNYWPERGPRWPEPIGSPYQPPPAYQAYPPFLEPNWRYDFQQPQKYHRGFHYWLDSF